jgi:Immunity protein 53
MNTIERLQNWYASKCDGEWEHGEGVKINSLDNPGWSIEIDAPSTGRMSFLQGEDGKYPWIEIEAKGDEIHACCGPNDLEKTLAIIMNCLDAEPPLTL